MVINIKSEQPYESNVMIKIAEGCVIKEKLPAMGSLKFRLETDEKVCLSFDETEENLIAKIVSRAIELLLNFFYYCISSDEFNTPHPIGNVGNYVSTNLYGENLKNKNIEIIYRYVNVFDSMEVKVGWVGDNRQAIQHCYEINETAYHKEYLSWLRQSLLFLSPGVCVCMIAGIVGILGKHYLCAVFFVLVLALFIYLIARFKTNSKSVSEKQLDSLKQWAKRESKEI